MLHRQTGRDALFRRRSRGATAVAAALAAAHAATLQGLLVSFLAARVVEASPAVATAAAIAAPRPPATIVTAVATGASLRSSAAAQAALFASAVPWHAADAIAGVAMLPGVAAARTGARRLQEQQLEAKRRSIPAIVLFTMLGMVVLCPAAALVFYFVRLHLCGAGKKEEAEIAVLCDRSEVALQGSEGQMLPSAAPSEAPLGAAPSPRQTATPPEAAEHPLEVAEQQLPAIDGVNAGIVVLAPETLRCGGQDMKEVLRRRRSRGWAPLDVNATAPQLHRVARKRPSSLGESASATDPEVHAKVNTRSWGDAVAGLPEGAPQPMMQQQNVWPKTLTPTVIGDTGASAKQRSSSALWEVYCHDAQELHQQLGHDRGGGVTFRALLDGLGQRLALSSHAVE